MSQEMRTDTEKRAAAFYGNFKALSAHLSEKPNDRQAQRLLDELFEALAQDQKTQALLKDKAPKAYEQIKALEKSRQLSLEKEEGLELGLSL